jgi:hypothetical protein
METVGEKSEQLNRQISKHILNHSYILAYLLPGHYNSVEGQARLRAVPFGELPDRMII